ncbi:hypothetical protein CC78DRAFT_530572 [Lojkania enalia]|uniref:Uncharacterized protein n=1 Tax=Lojkania enalia TaxID=147567 RepID=A0A9P4KGY3_9PLEO|nr:hypothetical protein CC78DRAFT_530572 [Didymosphaeria enalia]
MASSSVADREPPAIITNGVAPPLRASRLPWHLRAPIFIVLSIFIRTTLLSISADFLGEELGKVSRTQDDLARPFAHLASKVVLLWLGWQANYDFIDITALTVITNTPFAYLLLTYYDVSLNTIAAQVVIEIISIALPTYLLRPRSAVHNPNAPLRDRFLLNSFQVQWTTALLAITSYVVVFYVGQKSQWLNTFLVTHFTTIPTLEPSHNETAISLVLKTFAAGIAAREFLLNPSIGARTASGSTTPVEQFDPATATLPATLKHNFWFFSGRTKILIRQTTVLTAFLFANTVQRVLTINGTDFAGAAGYAAWWIAATLITAGWWTWVGDIDS